MEKEENKKHWVKWAGIGAFAFFFIKGMLWLLVPLFVWLQLR